MGTKGSAAGFAEKRPDHLHPEGMVTKGSAAGFAAKRLDHLHSEVGDGHKGSAAGFAAKKITYFLRAGEDHQGVSTRFCSKEAGSLTS